MWFIYTLHISSVIWDNIKDDGVSTLVLENHIFFWIKRKLHNKFLDKKKRKHGKHISSLLNIEKESISRSILNIELNTI